MKTQNKRIEDLEVSSAPAENFICIRQDLKNKDLYHYRNMETGKEQVFTEEEAKKVFSKNCTLFVIKYVENWNDWKKQLRMNGDIK